MTVDNECTWKVSHTCSFNGTQVWTSKGPSKNYVTRGEREGVIKNRQILVTKSDKGGREVGWNSDIITPNFFYHDFSNFSTCPPRTSYSPRPTGLFRLLRLFFYKKLAYPGWPKKFLNFSSIHKKVCHYFGRWQGEGGRWNKLVTKSDKGGREGQKLPFWRWHNYWMAPKENR